jgi:hypothetical protein
VRDVCGMKEAGGRLRQDSGTACSWAVAANEPKAVSNADPSAKGDWVYLTPTPDGLRTWPSSSVHACGSLRHVERRAAVLDEASFTYVAGTAGEAAAEESPRCEARSCLHLRPVRR